MRPKKVPPKTRKRKITHLREPKLHGTKIAGKRLLPEPRTYTTEPHPEL